MTNKEIFQRDSLFIKHDPRQKRWAIPYNHQCLNARVNNILVAQEDCVRGKRVLDLASHMGTFSYAALKLGAREVVGVEIEEELVKKSEWLFKQHEAPKKRYRFENSDVITFLERNKDSFDTVFCFGLLYYLADPYRLLDLISRTAGETILLDTFTALYGAVQGKEADSINNELNDKSLDLPLMLYILTQPGKAGYTLKKQFIQRRKNLVLQGLPTKNLLETFFDSLGMDHQQLDWRDYIEKPVHWRGLISNEAKKNSHWADVYSSGIRVAYRLSV